MNLSCSPIVRPTPIDVGTFVVKTITMGEPMFVPVERNLELTYGRPLGAVTRRVDSFIVDGIDLGTTAFDKRFHLRVPVHSLGRIFDLSQAVIDPSVREFVKGLYSQL